MLASNEAASIIEDKKIVVIPTKTILGNFSYD
ncbi:MAG: hypothetical protein ACLT33_01050 [Lachnospira pectinoschiza]